MKVYSKPKQVVEARPPAGADDHCVGSGEKGRRTIHDTHASRFEHFKAPSTREAFLRMRSTTSLGFGP